MGNMEKETDEDVLVLANLQAECGKRAAAGDWQGMEHIANAICALSKGKGKGKGGGSYGKGGKGLGKGGGGGSWQAPQGGALGGKPGSQSAGTGKGKGKGGKGGTFDGNCHHCGKYGHRKNECRSLDADMAKHRGLNNTDVDEDGNEKDAKDGQDGKDEPEDDDVWWMGGLNAITRGTPAVAVSGRFDALIEEEEGPTPWESMACKECTPRASPVAKGAAGGRIPEGGLHGVRPKRKFRPLNLCDYEHGPEEEPSLNALGKKTPGAILIEAVVDSGAADPVARAGTFAGKVTASPMSKAGQKYRGPDGTRIPNSGQQKVSFTSDEGHKCGMTWQIADVERPLIAVSHLSAAGNKVIFSKTGGEVVNTATGKRIAFQKKGGVYVLRMWIPGPKESSPTPFPRPAATS
jgi:hypothetical protein